jgi:carbon-monoxide dehydrogenase small subunit
MSNEPTGTAPISVSINGQKTAIVVDTNKVLVDMIREDLGLTGTNVGCRTGDCGACTVMVDAQVVKSCLRLAASVDGAEITTIEGLADRDGKLSPVQQAFWDEYGFQCGYCLAGMLFCARELLEENPQPDEAEIRHAIDGNLCRCTGYHGIVRAVKAAADEGASAV